MNDEYFDLVNEDGKIIGRASRRECHGNPKLIHRSIRVVVYHSDGNRILLQKRSMRKDIFPGRWDMAVGGHVDSGEEVRQAAIREMGEELGLSADLLLQELYKIKVRNEIESENVQAFSVVCDGPFHIQPEELDEVRFFTFAELRKLCQRSPEIFTPLLVRELEILLK